eukprot:TRINITY_DN3168_c0_g2_i1.p1 TRINITY_DN3168_c0_g2~~TRINITY_DN3168_c0_g2_i1.p1  ORF type:complete len:351 (-),score=53.97 TRINITY_DN3168_c0_g2_i1:49-1047(-)
MDNVFTTQLPAGMTDPDVTKMFGQYGKVASVRIVSKPGMNFTSALVRFQTPEDAKYVVENLHGNIPAGCVNPIEARYAQSGNNKGAGKAGGGYSGGGGYPPAAGGMGGQGMGGMGMGGMGDMGMGGMGDMGMGGMDGWQGGHDGWQAGGQGGWQNGQAGWQGGMDMGMAGNGAMGGMGGGMGGGKGGKGGGKGHADQFVDAIEKSNCLPGAGMSKSQLTEVYVFGLPPDTNNFHLYKIFAPFGQIAPRGCTATLAKDTGLCRGFGFINFLTPESANLAIRSLNGFVFPDGKALRVELKGPGKQAALAASSGPAGADASAPPALPPPPPPVSQ